MRDSNSQLVWGGGNIIWKFCLSVVYKRVVGVCIWVEMYNENVQSVVLFVSLVYVVCVRYFIRYLQGYE